MLLGGGCDGRSRGGGGCCDRGNMTKEGVDENNAVVGVEKATGCLTEQQRTAGMVPALFTNVVVWMDSLCVMNGVPLVHHA